jgi:MFS family permease
MRLTRMVMGMGESTSWPASNRVIREWFPGSERGRVNGIFGAGAASGLPTMHLTMEWLASGAGDQRFAWQRGDTFSVPCWTSFERAAADAQLFSMSNEPLMRFSRFYRFEAD